jgi:hypothetical protein
VILYIRLKVEQVQAVIARYWDGKHVSAAADTDAAYEDAVISTLSLLGSGAINTFTQQQISMQQ